MQLECFFPRHQRKQLALSYYTASAVILPALKKKKAFPYHQPRRGTGERLTVLCRSADRYQTAHGWRSICPALFMRRSALLYFTTATTVNYLKVVLLKVVLSAAQSTFSPQPSSACLPKSNSPPAGLSTSQKKFNLAADNTGLQRLTSVFQHCS